jgi:hypothetical protein
VSNGLSPPAHDEGRETGTELRLTQEFDRVPPPQLDDAEPPVGFLASNDARRITGETLIVLGGEWVAHWDDMLFIFQGVMAKSAAESHLAILG